MYRVKKIKYLIILIAVLCVVSAAAVLSACGAKVTVEYSAAEGGFIAGEAVQTVGSGKDCRMVQAVPLEGYKFLEWSDGLPEAVRRDKNVKSDLSVTALFVKKEYTVTYTCTQGGSIEGAAEQSVEYGGSATEVTAVANRGYVFDKWSDGSTAATREDTCIDGNLSVVAMFAKEYWSITYTSNNYYASDLTEPTEFTAEYGNVIGVTVQPAAGFKFVGWSDGRISPTRFDDYSKHGQTIEAIFEIEYLDLPVMIINTENEQPILDKENYIACDVSVQNAGVQYEFTEKTAKIKGRGNTTWDFEKKPYKLKFDKKIDLFGNGSAKKWALLANYADKSLLRNDLAFAIGDVLGLEYNNQVQPIELFVNGEYLGVYLVCEQTETGTYRVDIDESINPEDQAFLVELDARAPNEGVEGLDWFYLDGIPYAVKGPDTEDENYSEEVTAAVQQFLTDCFNVVNGDSYEDIMQSIDVESFAKTYIVSELLNQVDVGYSSFYMYRDCGGKLFCGPLWDFDLSCGNVNYYDGARYAENLWAAETNVWYRALLGHAEFKAMVAELLQEYSQDIIDKTNQVAEAAKAFADSYERNFLRWDILGVYVWPNPPEIIELDTWEKNIEFVLDYINRSMEYMLSVYCNQV